MWQSKKSLYCPVCSVEIGYWSGKFKQTFICNECLWLYEATPEEKKLKALHKVDAKKAPARCGCKICGR